MALITCPECGKKFSEFAECCPQCGFPTSEIQTTINCPECGKEISNKATDCPYCGFPIDSDKKELIGEVGGTVRTKREDNSNEQPDGFNGKQEDKVREVVQRKAEGSKGVQYQRRTGNKKSLCSIITTIVFLVLFCLYQFGAIDCSRSSGTKSTANSQWVGVWYFFDSWKFDLRSDKSAVVTISDETYTTTWEDGGKFAVVGAFWGDTFLIREDGQLFTRGKDGNVTGILKLQKKK